MELLVPKADPPAASPKEDSLPAPKAVDDSPMSRRCLICGASTKTTHHGIDACRACSIFYRRTREAGRSYVCRLGRSQCEIDREEGLNCKKCRFDRFIRILDSARSEAASGGGGGGAFRRVARTPLVTSTTSIPTPSTPITSIASPSHVVVASPDSSNASVSKEDDHQLPSTSSATFRQGHVIVSNAPTRVNLDELPSSPSPSEVRRPMIERLRQSYALLCMLRRTSELSTRKETRGAFHPASIATGELPLVPATYTMMNTACRILVHSIFDFASTAFTDFAALDKAEKWPIIANYFYNFKFFESLYRASKYFPDNDLICFGCYTAYIDVNNLESFFSDAPADASLENRKDAKKIMFDNMSTDLVQCRAAMRRMPLDEEEFMAALGLAMWNIGSTPAPDHVMQIGEKYRAEILRDLHVYYKDVKKYEDYASRLGGLFFQLMTIQSSASKFMNTFEIYRLLDVFNDDTFGVKLMHNASYDGR